MGEGGVAGRIERSCLIKTLAAMELSPEVNARLASHASDLLDEIGRCGGQVETVATPGMLAAIALAVDRGVRVVVVVVSDVERVGRVAEQLRAVAWLLAFASTEPEVWETDLPHIRKHVGNRGVLVTCARNVQHLGRVHELLQRVDGGAYPALVIEEKPEAPVSAQTRARLDELRRLLWRSSRRLSVDATSPD